MALASSLILLLGALEPSVDADAGVVEVPAEQPAALLPPPGPPPPPRALRFTAEDAPLSPRLSR